MKLQRNGRTKALAIGAVAVVSSLTLAACGSNNNSSTNAGGSTPAASSSSTGGSAASACGSGQLLGAGSTAQQNAVTQWVKDFQTKCPSVTVNYQGTGSGAGLTSFEAGKVAFAGSDAAMKPADVTKTKAVCPGGQGIDLPMIGGPIAIAYNLPGVNSLVLDAPTLAKIFTGKITNWNDTAIKTLNPSAALPNLPIQTFHRVDSSGTTNNFTAYLNATDPTDFPYKATKVWPAKGGQSANGSAGLAAQVKAVKGSISYFEMSYATEGNFSTVQIATGAPAPVAVSAANATTTIADAPVVGTGDDLSLKINYATKAPNAYPITLVTYEIVCDKGNNASSLPALKAFLNYTISTAGQQSVTSLGYVPLPAALQTKVQAEISNLG
ncbi:phosphate ABC transporter substrate-binding protein PstS [Streptacidiphilus sp. PB12-B1b]|uniref:phosphate ABC transporter substrate-binding protein PstS n=1 Tax=Streptacidiphilus sp. PB12-B1b TaxID=2705012 RepID=UPI0015FBF69D|nr:phosphate ABC transporter substrate-binding protein PstS [Streptacidiphilus sp. PB12-B1b]QMU79639.1 phosphate ABC transporter substrate-binding protein PstS [Streptacidiphilus sp. PB12-B1b]